MELFSGVDISSFSYSVRCDAGFLLAYDGDRADKLVFLVAGSIKSYKTDSSFNDVYLTTFSGFMLLNELDLSFSSSLECLTDVVLLEVDKEKFLEVVLPVKHLEFFELMCKKSLMVSSVLDREFCFDSVGKVCHLFFSDLVLVNSLKRKEVAALLNITPETFSRVLKKLTRDQIIQIVSNQILVLNEDKLCSYSQ